MMEAIDRWWEEKDLGREEKGPELTQSLPVGSSLYRSRDGETEAAF